MFFTYDQNNSGGFFDYDAEAGISHYVIVEADNASEADRIAEGIGLYFDGSGDCECCGVRWDSVEDDWFDPAGTDRPSIHGRPVTDGKPLGMWDWPWMGDSPEGFIHYKNGKKEAIWYKDGRQAVTPWPLVEGQVVSGELTAA